MATNQLSTVDRLTMGTEGGGDSLTNPSLGVLLSALSRNPGYQGGGSPAFGAFFGVPGGPGTLGSGISPFGTGALPGGTGVGSSPGAGGGGGGIPGVNQPKPLGPPTQIPATPPAGANQYGLNSFFPAEQGAQGGFLSSLGGFAKNNPMLTSALINAGAGYLSQPTGAAGGSGNYQTPPSMQFGTVGEQAANELAINNLLNILMSNGRTDPRLLQRNLVDIQRGTEAQQGAVSSNMARRGFQNSAVGQAVQGAIGSAGQAQQAQVQAQDAAQAEARRRADLELFFNLIRGPQIQREGIANDVGIAFSQLGAQQDAAKQAALGQLAGALIGGLFNQGGGQ